MSFPPALWMLLADAAQPAQRVAAHTGGMSEELKLAITVGASIILAAIVAVFYLGRKVGAFGATVTAFTMQVKSFDEATREATRLGEKWNSDLLAALREVDERLGNALMRITDLEYKWRESHGVAGRVKELEEWRREIDTRLEEQDKRFQGSRRIVIEEPVPVLEDLFEASGRKDGEDK
jgi:hypothetical protein